MRSPVTDRPPAGDDAVPPSSPAIIPDIPWLVALFTAAGGIFVRGNLHGSPATNLTIMAVGSFLASVMGTAAGPTLPYFGYVSGALLLSIPRRSHSIRPS